jgi:hypothetical protein
MLPRSSRSRTKLAVAWMSMAEGCTGITMQLARDSMSCSSRPEAPAGASMISWRVPSGTCRPKLRRPTFCGAALAPWIFGASGSRTRSQLSVEPCWS